MNLVNEGVLPPNEPDDRDERMEARDMAQEREGIADILAEMRREIGDGTDTYCGKRIIRRMEDDCVRQYCDRIEAAWKREHPPVGNAAAMREAVEAALKTIRGVINGTIARTNNSVFDCRDRLKAALSAPARNCDMLSAEQCKEIFKMEMGIYLTQEATDRDRDIALCTAYGVIDTLLATAAERKGADNGR